MQRIFSFLVGTIWTVEHRRNGVLIGKDSSFNTVTNEGLNHNLNVYFKGYTPITSWYILVYETNTTPSGTTTYATPVFTETTTAYDETTRRTCTFGTVSSQTITNSASPGTFTFNTGKTIYGAALVGGGGSPTVKGNTAGGGVMFCASLFSVAKSVVAADTLTVTVTGTAASV